jgi:hypothetical protein
VCFYPPGQGIVIRIYQDEADFDQLDTRCREINLELERRVGPIRSTTGRTPALPQPPGPALPDAWTSPSSPATNRIGQSGLPGWAWLLLVILGLWAVMALFL